MGSAQKAEKAERADKTAQTAIAGRTGSSGRDRLLRAAAILAGSVLYGMGTGLFIENGRMVPGGINGISIIICSVTGWRVGALSFLLNIPLLAAALRLFGRGFFLGTLYTLAASSFFIDLFAGLEPVTNDRTLCAFAGGTLLAVGLGIIIRCGASTGGVDIIVKFIKSKRPYLKTGAIFMAFDSVVALASGTVLGGWESVIYSMLTICICAAALNLVLYGPDEARLLLIVCNKSDEVVKALTVGLGAGASVLKASGGYTGSERAVVMCAVRNTALFRAKELVSECDGEAFIIVTPAAAIYGEGFKSYEDSEL